MAGRAALKRVFVGFLFVFLLLDTPSWADLSPSGAFTLIKRVPPGGEYRPRVGFFGRASLRSAFK